MISSDDLSEFRTENFGLPCRDMQVMPKAAVTLCVQQHLCLRRMVNSIEQFTEDTFTVDVNEDLGRLYFKIDAGYSHETELLLNSLILGLQGG